MHLNPLKLNKIAVETYFKFYVENVQNRCKHFYPQIITHAVTTAIALELNAIAIKIHAIIVIRIDGHFGGTHKLVRHISTLDKLTKILAKH